MSRLVVPGLRLDAVVLSRTPSSEDSSNALSSSGSTKHPSTPVPAKPPSGHTRVPSGQRQQHAFHIATDKVRAATSQTVSGRPVTLSGRKASSAPTGRARRPVPAECPRCHTREYATPCAREGIWICHSEYGREGTGYYCGHIWRVDDEPRFCARRKCPSRWPMELEVHVGGIVGYACTACKSFFADSGSDVVPARFKKMRIRHYTNESLAARR